MKRVFLIPVLIGLLFLCIASAEDATSVLMGSQLSGDACYTANWHLWKDWKCYCSNWNTWFGRLSPQCTTIEKILQYPSSQQDISTPTVVESTPTVVESNSTVLEAIVKWILAIDYSQIVWLLIMVWTFIKRPIAPIILILSIIYWIIKFIKRARYN